MAPGNAGCIILTPPDYPDVARLWLQAPPIALAVENGTTVFGHAIGPPGEHDLGSWFRPHYLSEYEVAFGPDEIGLLICSLIGHVRDAWYIREYDVVIVTAQSSRNGHAGDLAICIDVTKLPALAARLEREFPPTRAAP